MENSSTNRLVISFLRIFFRLLYNEFSFFYDFVAAMVSLGMWRQWIMAVLPFIQGTKILEIGHGPGHLQAALHREGLHPFGLDASWRMVCRANGLLRKMGFGEKVRLVNGYAQFLPFSSFSFSTVIATFPSEFISSRLSISEIFRILQPNGRLIVLPFAWITGHFLFHRLAAWLFYVTRQTPSNSESILGPLYISPLRRAGFLVNTQTVLFENSSVLLIIATKPE